MEEKKTTPIEPKVETKVKEVEKKVKKPTYKLRDLLKSETYRHKIDILRVVLVEDKEYTKEEVEKAIDTFLKRKVK